MLNFIMYSQVTNKIDNNIIEYVKIDKIATILILLILSIMILIDIISVFYISKGRVPVKVTIDVDVDIEEPNDPSDNSVYKLNNKQKASTISSSLSLKKAIIVLSEKKDDEHIFLVKTAILQSNLKYKIPFNITLWIITLLICLSNYNKS